MREVRARENSRCPQQKMSWQDGGTRGCQGVKNIIENVAVPGSHGARRAWLLVCVVTG